MGALLESGASLDDTTDGSDGASGSLTGRPGCLTIASEEEETWTAGSLRAFALRRETRGEGRDKTLTVTFDLSSSCLLGFGATSLGVASGTGDRCAWDSSSDVLAAR